jgi:hypothetical protein
VDDTSAKCDARYFELLRLAGPEKRVEIWASLTRATRELAIAGIKDAHKGHALSDDELRYALADRLYGTAVARRLYGHRVP